MDQTDALPEQTLHFFCEDIDFELPFPQEVSLWISKVVSAEGKRIESVSYIFCSDDYLHELNVTYLGHDTLTDIITFPFQTGGNTLESDIFISIERVKDNAASFQVSFQKELLRVMIHGILHLCGYGDKTDEEAAAMRKKENEAIALFENGLNTPFS